ncbi:hypothetical protein [uncultured Winogradskyella sp.]|uniref:hypothetical protein n=1 Tax=uncultured Winogradskyella sp. TaxID=395353 RepID=UPI00261CDDA9|nr:hypothetical protein [uncultured Winogradskyella sp.]
MKKILLLAIFSLSTFTILGQTNLFQHEDFENLTKDHKKIAIVPFKTTVKLRPRKMKELKEGDLEKIEKAEGIGLQVAMHSWFLKRRKRGTMEVDVQDPKRTNAILKKSDISYENIEDQLPEDLAKLLDVDAVISGTFETDKPMSDGASIALGVVFGFFGNTNSATINMSIHNGSDAELLWNYNKKVRGSIGSDSDDLVNILMRKASRRLGYTD